MREDHELVPNYTLNEVPLQDQSFYVDKRWMSPEKVVMTINGQSDCVSVVKRSSMLTFLS